MIMSPKDKLKEITTAIVDFKVDEIRSVVQDALDSGLDPMSILNACRNGMNIVGDKFEDGEYFFADLIMGGETMKEALKVLKPHLVAEKKAIGKVVMGTIEGDLHDIGKDIVSTLIVSAGIDVYDLGIDVPPTKFAEKAKEVNADVIGISSLLSTSVPTCKKVVEELKKRGLRDKVKVIIGGGAVRKKYIKELGVDAAVNDAVEGVRIIQSWVIK